MPLYEYLCATCGRFEVIRKFSDKALKKCPTCGRKVEKLASAPAFQFKGTGWYVTDYAKKSNGGGDKDKGDKKDSDAKPSDSGTKSEAGGSSDKASSDSTSSDSSDAKPTASKKPASSKKSSASGSSPT